VAINYASTSTCGTASTPGAFLSSPNAVTIDLDGNVWIANGQATNGNLVELSPSGVAKVCTTPGAGAIASNGAVFIDSTGKVWTALAGASSIYRFTPVDQSTLTFNATGPILTISGDGSGNVYFTTATGLYEIAGGANVTSSSTPTLISTGVVNATSLMPDVNGFLWASSGTGLLGQITPGTLATTTVTTYNTPTATQGIAVTGANNVFVSSVTPGNSISYFAPQGSPATYTLQGGYPTAASLGGINQPAGIAVDGASNVWSANSVANSNGLFGISEISLAGAPISPDTAAGGFQKSSSFLNASSSLIVDQSGNVWVVGGSAANNFVTEFVGAGVPIFEPYAEGLATSPIRFQAKP
jgi:streptogramin lyase